MRERGGELKSCMVGVLFCALYIVISGVLINYNKFLLKRFPYPLELTAMHMSFCGCFSLVVYRVFPNAFRAMPRLQGQKLGLVVNYFMPLGCLFAISLYTSNKAYLYCSVAFLQFMKEGNVVVVFLLSCAVGLQRMDCKKGGIILWVLAGSALSVDGEVNFVLVGFMLQVCSQLAESSKNVLGEFIMKGSGFKLDPLSYIMFMAPSALIFLMVGIVFTWEREAIAAARENWHYLLPNALLAYSLNVTIAAVLENCSAMALIWAGLLKDITIVVVSSHLFGDTVTPAQYIGFAITLAGVSAWSLIKQENWKDCEASAKDSEALPLNAGGCQGAVQAARNV